MFDVRWGEPIDRLKIRNDASDLGAELWTRSATAEWSGRAGDFEFVSDPAPSSISLVASGAANATASSSSKLTQ